MKKVQLFAVLGVLLILADAHAGRRSFQGGCSGGNCSNGSCASGNCGAPQAAPQATQPVADCLNGQCQAPGDALAELNARRVSMGLKPYIHDPGLEAAAKSAATFRATHGIQGHVSGGDFQFLPPGTSCNAAGCGALPPHWGFQACCQHETKYTHAGAASVHGRDGRVYHHLFVR